MLSQSLPNACNSNLKGSLRPRLSFHWSFLSLHSKFMCRVELQGSFKPLKWFAEQPVELECGRCLNGLWTWLNRRGAVFVSSSYCSVWVAFLLIRPQSGLQAATWQMCSFRSIPLLLKILVSNPGSTWLFKSKATPFRNIRSFYFHIKWQAGDHNEISYRVTARKYLWSVVILVIIDKGRYHYPI